MLRVSFRPVPESTPLGTIDTGPVRHAAPAGGMEGLGCRHERHDLELDTPRGQMMATMLAGVAQFEHDLISERVKSGLAATKAPGEETWASTRATAKVGQTCTESASGGQ